MTDKPITIFYSWQSDLPNNKTRGFIQSCIEAAIKSLRSVVLVEAERDTVGVSGTPDIVQTIFSRIDNCDLFIADVSAVGMYNPETNPERTKLIPNPNVMLELGYAAKTLSWDNVICLRNTDFGTKGELPFDLAHRRLTGFSLEGEKSDVVRKYIRSIIADAVMEIHEKGPRVRAGYAMHTVGSCHLETAKITSVLQPLDLQRSERCIEKRQGYLYESKQLITTIKSLIVCSAQLKQEATQLQDSNSVVEEWMNALGQERPISLKNGEIDFIRDRAKMFLDIELDDDFFSVGNLRCAPSFMNLGSLKYIGTNEEIQKYEELHSLSYLFSKVDLLDYFLDTFDDIVLLPLAIHNVSTISDEDISIIIKANPDEVDTVIPSRYLFNESCRSEGDKIGLEGFAYDENLPCVALFMPQTADIQYDTDISFDIADAHIENKRNIMKVLRFADSQSDYEDYEREICKYIATPMNEQLDSYMFTIKSLRPNEKKWVGPLIALCPKAEKITLEYFIRSAHSDGQISGNLELNL